MTALPFRTLSEQEWRQVAHRAKVSAATVRNRLKAGWSLDDALEAMPLSAKYKTAMRIRDAVAEHPKSVLADIRRLCPDLSPAQVEAAVRRCVREGFVLREAGIRRGKKVQGIYSVPNEPLESMSTTPSTPKWIHPIRARLLGLPVAASVVKRYELPPTYRKFG